MVLFGGGVQEDVPAALYGNKAANLATMSARGVPVPPGFTLGISVCEEYYRNGRVLPADVPALIREGIAFLEQTTGRTFGSPRRPLLVSVRSGAPVSLPGVMETLLNIGLTRETLRGLILSTGSPRFAWDAYRRLLEGYGTIVSSHDPEAYRQILKDRMEHAEILEEKDIDAMTLQEIAGAYETRYADLSGHPFPSDPFEQLLGATEAVILSASGERAQVFRRLNPDIDIRGTAVTVQEMVFGNMGVHSGAGIAFTRNPWSGENRLLVDFRFGAQGGDVVSGEAAATSCDHFIRKLPSLYDDLCSIGRSLEEHFKDMQDLEFTIQEGRLYVLQSRSGKRGPLAALRIAVEMAGEGIITENEALGLLKGVDLGAITLQHVDADARPLATGLSASVGAVSGAVALTSERAIEDAGQGPVILVREMASPDDIAGIDVAEGLLVARGARTSHAAVVARHMGKVCIVNCTALSVEPGNHLCRFGDEVIHEGETITLDGDTGAVYRGVVPVVQDRPDELIAVVDGWRRARGEGR